MVPPVLAKLFPFFFRLDAEGTVVEAGPSLLKLAPDALGRAFDDVFIAISREVDTPTTLSLRQGGVTLRGQFTEHEQVFMFVGSPQLSQHSGLASMSLGELGLVPSDFAAHDALPEMVTLLGVADAQVQSLNDLAGELEEQRAALHLANVEAEAARGEAELASTVKSRFLAVMTHELRTPLNAIIGLTQLVLESELAADQRELLKVVDGASQTLLSLVGDILDFSKIEAGRLELDMRPFSVPGLVNMVAALVRARAVEKRLRFDVFIADGVPIGAVGDELRVKQVLLNLLGNAVKFTPPDGSVRLEVSYAEGALRFDVVDTGIGIEPAKLDHIFEPFTQADSSTTRSFGGTGLGLTISRQLSEAMRGTLRVTSEAGRGARFTLTFPAERTMPPTADQPVVSSAPTRPLQVLVAEDNTINALLVRKVLLGAGHTSTVVSNGQLAIDEALTGAYDVVLMDVQMPILDGLEATRRLRAHGYTRPVLGLTANATAEDIQACRASGMNDVLLKPFEPRKLRAMLAEAALDAMKLGERRRT